MTDIHWWCMRQEPTVLADYSTTHRKVWQTLDSPLTNRHSTVIPGQRVTCTGCYGHWLSTTDWLTACTRYSHQYFGTVSSTHNLRVRRDQIMQRLKHRQVLFNCLFFWAWCLVSVRERAQFDGVWEQVALPFCERMLKMFEYYMIVVGYMICTCCYDDELKGDWDMR
jgi:hypothetical protein